MYEKYLLKKLCKILLMNSTESKIGLLLEDAQTALERGVKRGAVKMDIQLEIRTLSFWRALTAECIATFLYSLLVSLMAATSVDSGPGSTQAYCGVVAGLAIATLATIFMPVSGAHINPAVSLSVAVIQRITPLRGAAYVVAQCGGAIAGASVVLGLYGNTEMTIPHHRNIGLAQFGLEFLLAFMIVLAYLRVTDAGQDQADKSLNPAISVGVAYMAALVAYRGTINPALALGQAFVRSRFSNLWIYWLGPVLGGCSAALCQEYIFSEQKDVHLSLTNAKNVKDDGKDPTDNDQGDEDVEDGKEIKDEPIVKPQKETSYNVNYKEPLTEHMLLPTPPLPPWKGRRGTVQRSYSSEMLTSDSFYGNGTGTGNGYSRDRDSRDRDREREPQAPTESSGYHSGSLSKPHKANSGTNRRTSQQQNSQSLQRTNSHKHGPSVNGNGGGGRSKHGSKETKVKTSSSKSPHVVPRNHHSHDSHYFVDY